jgi:hypothetical protein
MLSVITLNVVMLSVTVPANLLRM